MYKVKIKFKSNRNTRYDVKPVKGTYGYLLVDADSKAAAKRMVTKMPNFMGAKFSIVSVVKTR